MWLVATTLVIMTSRGSQSSIKAKRVCRLVTVSQRRFLSRLKEVYELGGGR